MIGKVLNERYKIKKELGKGGMAIVYEAEDLLLDRKVAIKMLRPEYISNKEFIKKFRHEARAVAKISHPNVVSIFDIGQFEDNHYLIMENVEGDNLKDIIEKRGQLPPIEALDIANQICLALDLAHENDIIHCDIKPHNILINSDKKVKVTDFGIAKAVSASTLTMTDTIIGSAHYFSPEQAKGGKIEAHSDIYSLGIVLFEMLTGEVPFTGDSPVSVALKHIQKDPPQPVDYNKDLPEEVNELVMKAISKEPEKRFNSAREMSREITRIMKNLGKDKKSNKMISSSGKGDTKVIQRPKLNKEQENLDKNPDKNESKNKKRKGIFYSILKKSLWILLIIAIMAGSVLGMSYFFKSYTNVPTHEVPDLTGMEITKARNRMAQIGLNLETDKSVFNGEYKKDVIISQRPEAGEIIKQTRSIMVTVSKGPSQVEVPDLIEKREREAEIILENLGLKIGEKEYEFNPEIPENHVIKQDPEPEEELENGEEVSLIISKGDPPNVVKVPDLVGLNREQAEEKLEDNKLQTGAVSEEKTERTKAGQVVSQQYSAGEEVPENSKVDFTLSSGIENEETAVVHTRTVNFEVFGFEEQRIRIIVIDDNGEDEVYNKMHKPGDQVSTTVTSVGPTTYKIYKDGELIHEQDFRD